PRGTCVLCAKECSMVRIAVFLALAGCATTIAERDPSIDPTSPRAQEAPLAAAPELPRRDPALAVKEQRTEPPPSTPAPEHHHHADPPPPKPKKEVKPQANQVYTCPMHPEVRSDKPGKCPKCGMTLVPEQKP